MYTAPHVAAGADALTITFALTVTFTDGDTASDSVTVTVTPDRPPVAVAGANPMSVAPDGEVQLNTDGSGDPDDRPGYTNSPTGYEWSVAPSEFSSGLSATDIANPVYTAPPPAELIGIPSLTFTLTVTFTNDDGDVATATDSIVVAIQSVDADAVMEVSAVSVGAIDRSVATQSIGLIAQRFTAPAARAPSTSGGGQQRNQLARDDLHTDDLHADSDWRAENISRTPRPHRARSKRATATTKTGAACAAARHQPPHAARK